MTFSMYFMGAMHRTPSESRKKSHPRWKKIGITSIPDVMSLTQPQIDQMTFWDGKGSKFQDLLTGYSYSRYSALASTARVVRGTVTLGTGECYGYLPYRWQLLFSCKLYHFRLPYLLCKDLRMRQHQILMTSLRGIEPFRLPCSRVEFASRSPFCCSVRNDVCDSSYLAHYSTNNS